MAFHTTRIPAIVLLFLSIVQGQLQAQVLSATITTVDHNGYHISCFGAKDGQATVTVTGGTPPYIYDWTSGQNTSTVADLAPGYLKVKVTDANSGFVEADITLTQPEPLKLTLVPFKYPSGMNISCYECFNGSLDLQVTGGVGSYTYVWGDDITTQDRTGLGAMNYDVVVTDANSCYEKANTKLDQPEKATWGMGGNANTNPEQNYIGTSDDQDVVVKSNGVEHLRILSNGDIKLVGSYEGFGLLYRDQDGILRGGGDLPQYGPLLGAPCRDWRYFPTFWRTIGNDFSLICPDLEPVLGTLNAAPVRMITNGEVRMFISTEGKVGFGTMPPNGAIGDYRMFVENGISCRDVLVKLGAWPDFVFQPNYTLMPLDELRDYLKVNHHLPGIPSAAEVASKGGLEVGRMQTDLLKVVEEQTLYILQLEEGQRALVDRQNGLEEHLRRLEAKLH